MQWFSMAEAGTLTDLFIERQHEFVWLHCKQIHQLLVCRISDKAAAQRGLSAVTTVTASFAKPSRTEIFKFPSTQTYS